MADELVIGVDIGTTSVKAGLLNQNGELADSFAEPYPTRRPGGSVVEQDPDLWVSLVGKAFERFAGYADRVAAIGICSQVNTHVFVDARGSAICPAIVWRDGRCFEEASELDAKVSEKQKLAWWGAPMPIDASHVLSRMLWMARNRPDIWKQTAQVMLPKDYCIFKLTGEKATDALSNVGLVGPDLSLLPQALGLVAGSARRIVPVSAINTVVGTVRDGPMAGIPVANGTMDAWTGLLGSGGYKNGASVYLSGTSEIVGINSPAIHPTPGVIVFPPCEGVRIHAGPTQSGGAAQMWYCRLTGLSPKAMSEAAATSDFSRPAPLFLPHLQGERAPVWNANSRGMFLGLEEGTTSADTARSVYEGVAFSVRLLMEAVEASSGVSSPVINCGGGGFQSALWNQIRADILGRSLRTLSVKDPGVLGAAGIAGWAIGLHPSLADAFRRIIRFDRIFEPRPQLSTMYADLYALYVEAVAANASLSKIWLEAGSAGG